MADDIEYLILAPFRDIIEKGNVTVQNADQAEGFRANQMKKAGTSLLKEGKRAIKRLNCLCQKHLEEAGQCFVEFVKDEGKLKQNLKERKAG